MTSRPVIIGNQQGPAARVLTALSALNTPAPPAAEPGNLIQLSVGHALAASGVDVDHDNAVIRNVPFISVGPALGHGFEIDHQTLETVVSVMDANATSLKSRVSHPELNWSGSRDGLECLVGYPLNWKIVGNQVRGDIQLLKKSLLPNHREFLLTTAEERPTVFGISIVAAFDFDKQVDPDTGEERPPKARAVYCKAVDFVDDPAANRNGLLNQPTPPNGNATMNRRLRRYLESIGLAAGVSNEVALAFLATLTGKQKQIAEALKDAKDTDATLSAAIADKLKALGVDPNDPSLALNAPGTSGGAEGSSHTGLSNPPSTTGDNSNADGGPQGGQTPPNTPTGLGQAGAGNQPAAGTPPTALSAADVQRLIAQDRQAESTRHTQIRNLSSQLRLGDDFANRHIAQGTDFQTVQLLASEISSMSHSPVTGLSISVGDDGRESTYAGIADAIALRCGVELFEESTPAGGRTDPTRPVSLRRGADGQPIRREAHGRTAEFDHLSLGEICRRFLASLGVAGVETMDQWQLAKLATDPLQLAPYLGSVALSHSTSNFPGIFANVLNKLLLPGYEQAPSTHREFTMEREVNDFKEVKFNQLGHTSRLRQVLEGAEYTYGTLSEKTASARVYKFGLLIAMTWEMIVNDDLSAFTDSALAFAETAQYLEDDEFYTHLLSNPVLEEDSTALFHADHNNLNEGSAGALTGAKLTSMRTAMIKQTGIAPSANEAGRFLNIMPNKLLVPPELEVAAAQLVQSIVDPTKSNNTPNLRFLNTLTPVAEPRLSADSTTAYYLACSNRRSNPAGWVLRLRGYKAPSIEQINTGSSVDGMTYKCRHLFGKKITDFRGWQKNAGA